MSGLLADLYSAGDRMKRKLGGLLSDPMGTIALGSTRMAEDTNALTRLVSEAGYMPNTVSFHVGGKQHVDKVDPYTIGITWPAKPPKGDLYLELKGSVRAIYSGKLRAVTTAEFLGCLDGADYDFIADQVLRRLPRRKK